MIKFSTLFILCFGFSFSYGQIAGCTDANASNFNPLATINDGSCYYPNTTYIPEKISDLPSQVAETSGLIRLMNGFWTHNDSGNPSRLYLLDTITYEVVRSVYISNHTNIDWEEITHNGTYIFIGDFGNNNGIRTNLRILRFDLALLLDEDVDTIQTDVINFNYPDQTSFQSSNEHSFDCEAFIFFDDSLHLFTKHWGNGYTKHYTIPANPGNYTAVLKDSLFVDGQITSSHIQGDSLIVLLGYRPTSFYQPFLYLLWDFPGDAFFSGNKRQVGMGSLLNMGQNEAIHFTGDFSGYITSERVNQLNIDPAIYKFELTNLFPPLLSISDLYPSNADLLVFPNPSNGKVRLEAANIFMNEISLFDVQFKKIMHITIAANRELELDLDFLSPGTYFLKVNSLTGESFIKRIIIQ